jgi:hypothetical protein
MSLDGFGDGGLVVFEPVDFNLPARFVAETPLPGEAAKVNLLRATAEGHGDGEADRRSGGVEGEGDANPVGNRTSEISPESGGEDGSSEEQEGDFSAHKRR